MKLCLSLLAGVDIPIPECQLVLHQPTLREIALVGEEQFFSGVSLLCIDKSIYRGEEFKAQIAQLNNFQVLLSILEDKKTSDKKLAVQQVLQLLFPEFKILLTPRAFMFNQGSENLMIDESNFDSFQQVCRQVFCIKNNMTDNFNPANAAAAKIAEKILKARQKVAQLKAEEQKDASVLAQYISILTVGVSSMPLDSVLSLTLFQMHDLVERFSLYQRWRIDLDVRMAGGNPDKETEDWTKSIY